MYERFFSVLYYDLVHIHRTVLQGHTKSSNTYSFRVFFQAVGVRALVLIDDLLPPPLATLGRVRALCPPFFFTFVFISAKVMTQNYEGKRKRILGKRSVVAYKRPNFKKAIVTFENPQWLPKGFSGTSTS